MEFHEVKSNFIKAARHGLETGFSTGWERRYNARELILQELMPIAREGLTKAGIDLSDLEKYLSIIQERVTESKTGCQLVGRFLQYFNEI